MKNKRCLQEEVSMGDITKTLNTNYYECSNYITRSNADGSDAQGSRLSTPFLITANIGLWCNCLFICRERRLLPMPLNGFEHRTATRIESQFEYDLYDL